MAASTALERPRPAQPGKAAERRFFSSYILALALLVFVGFAPTFFLRGVVEPYWPPLRPMRPVVLLHGMVATAFVLVFPLQALLIAGGRQTLHRRIGQWAFVLGGAVAVTVYLVAADQYRRNIVPTQPVTDFVALVIALVVAWRWRWNAPAHKRVMVAILCLFAVTGFARVPFTDHYSFLGLRLGSWLPYIFVLPLWGWDLKTIGKVHPATVVATVIVSDNMLRAVLAPAGTDWAGLFSVLPGFAWP